MTPPPTLDLGAIGEARRTLAAAEVAARETVAKLNAALAEHARLRATGAAARAIAKSAVTVKQLRENQAKTSKQIKDAAKALLDLRRPLSAPKPDELVATLDGTYPVVMLPVRLETRFFNNGNELRIRIFPDQVHFDAHDASLTSDEQKAGIWYWDARTKGGTDTKPAQAAWKELSNRFGAPRAAWIAESTAAGKSPTSRPSSWSRPTIATSLPDRWVVIGYQNGQEQFKKWGNVIEDQIAVSLTPDLSGDTNPVAQPPTELELGSELEWIANYTQAESRGMAVTVTAADVPAGRPPLSGGVELLVVIGVNWSHTPDEAAAAVGGLLESHLYSDGLSVVPQGTRTNNTSTSAAAATLAATEAMDPLLTDGSASATPASTAIGVALGIADSPSLRRIPGGAFLEQETAARLLSAVWSSTLGYYLRVMLDPLVDEKLHSTIRDHAVQYVRAAGIAPTLRIGKQPYGILPILPRGGFVATSAFETNLAKFFARVREPWETVVDKVPRAIAGPTPDDPHGTLELRMHRMLQQAPVSATLRFRRIFAPTTAANSALPIELREVQERLMMVLRSHLGWSKRPYIAGMTADPTQYPLPVPFVQAKEPGPVPLSPNYIDTIINLAHTPSARAELERRLEDMEKGDTILESFLALSTIQAIDAGAMQALAPEVADSTKAEALRAGYFPIAEINRVMDRGNPPPGSVIIGSPGEASRVVLPAIDANRPIAELISASQADRALRALLPPAAIAPLSSLVQDLRFLAKRPASELDWAFRGVLDCMAYRLDAWITSVAARRLSELRKKPGRSTGTHIGGYGWVEHLTPRAAAASSLGHMLAPSLPHAATAAILRSGFQAHTDAGGAALDIDLSSARVSLALRLLEDVASGQPLAALLGYRFERGLRTRDVKLARFILPTRRVVPLRAVRAGTPPSTAPTEAVAVRDVCDGVALLDRYRSDAGKLLADIRAAATPASSDAAEVAGLMGGVEQEIKALSNLMDAVNELLVSESVYQTMLGNADRAGAALAVLDRQIRPLQPQVAETPRSGRVYTQRVGVVTDERLPVPTGATPLSDPVLTSWEPFSTDARAIAEPRINAWIARMLGNPAGYEFTAQLITKRQDGTESRTSLGSVSLAALQLSPLRLLAAARSGSQGQPSELHQRLVAGLLAGITAPAADAVIELDPDPPQGSNAVGLAALESILALLTRLLGGMRSIDNRDFASPATPPATDVVVSDLSGRSTALDARVRGAARTLATALAASPPDPATVFDALTSVSNIGVDRAFPAIISTGGRAQDSPEITRLLDQARDVNAGLTGALGRIDALDTAWTARADKPTFAELEYHSARIRELLGKDFPLVVPFQLSDPSELAASLADQTALNGSDALAVPNWLQRLSMVRPALDRFAATFTAADLLGNVPDNGGLVICQLPHEPGQRWLALEKHEGIGAASLAIVLHSFSVLSFPSPITTISGFIVDDWSEMIPSPQETVAATFHYDAPAARPPQAILVATPPNIAMANWTTDLLVDVVKEARDLAKLRMVGPEQLDLHGLLLPAIYLPDGFTQDVPTIKVKKFMDMTLPALASSAAGKLSVWTSS